MRLFSIVLILLFGCDGSPEPGAACEVDRQCSDGDLCNGAERCVAERCEDGPTMGQCPAVGGWECEACADDETCLSGVCTPSCIAPPLPVFATLPMMARFAVPRGVAVTAALEGGETAARGPSPRAFAVLEGTLVLEHAGRVRLEASFVEPGECTHVWSSVIDVVETIETSPELAADAVAMDDPRIVAWAQGYRDHVSGLDLDPIWSDPNKALGAAQGTFDDALSLGNGGHITMVFGEALADHPGPDLAVFENGFSESFLELAFVEVSSNGVDFARFPTYSHQTKSVEPYGTLDPAELLGVAGRFRAGFGQAFDLATLEPQLAVQTGRVDLSDIRFVRVVDIVGDGSMSDAFGAPIYDPTPTFGPSGFDLEAIAVLRASR